MPLASRQTPDIQFSNDPSQGASTLSGEVNRVRTFKGDGINNQINMSWRLLPLLNQRKQKAPRVGAGLSIWP